VSKSPGRWAKRLGIILLLVIGGVFLMSLFYRLPDISSRTQSYAIDDGATTSIGRLNAPQLSAHPGKSGSVMGSEFALCTFSPQLLDISETNAWPRHQQRYSNGSFNG
jgi:hypothetical protein